MEKVMLYSGGSVDTTTVSNVFIDSYMPQANGSYVKVYLYLLRCLSGQTTDFSISHLADHLENTEKDIIRALKYWEKVRLIQLSSNASGAITSITLNQPFSPNTEPVLSDAALPLAVTQEMDSCHADNSLSNDCFQTNDNSHANASIVPDPAVVPPSVPERPIYTNAQITELSNNDEVKWIMNIIELYLERPLKPKDVQLILYLYDSVEFSPELIMYLYEYCISKSKKNAAYIEAVALSWAEQGITNVEQAEAANTVYNSSYNAVTKAFGLNRAPGAVEKTFINKWMSNYSMTIEIIVEACNRTLLNTQKADFKYADKILENWSKQGVTKPADIKKLDLEFSSTKHTAVPSTAKETPVKPANNRFNAFPQRNYTKEDFADIEKRLLNRG